MQVCEKDKTWSSTWKQKLLHQVSAQCQVSSFSPWRLHLHRTNGERPPTLHPHHHRWCWHSPSLLMNKKETYTRCIAHILSVTTKMYFTVHNCTSCNHVDSKTAAADLHRPLSLCSPLPHPRLQLQGCNLWPSALRSLWFWLLLTPLWVSPTQPFWICKKRENFVSYWKWKWNYLEFFLTVAKMETYATTIFAVDLLDLVMTSGTQSFLFLFYVFSPSRLF